MVQNNVTVGAFEDHSLAIHKVPEDLFKQQIGDHKKMLEDKPDVEIRYFGIKEGIPNRAVRELVASQGYRAFLTKCPTFRKPSLDWVGKVQVDNDDFNIFLTKISSTYLFFKDKKNWKYIRKFKLDGEGHRVSETYDQLRKKGETGR
jgi:hypothetical protein